MSLLAQLWTLQMDAFGSVSGLLEQSWLHLMSTKLQAAPERKAGLFHTRLSATISNAAITRIRVKFG